MKKINILLIALFAFVLNIETTKAIKINELTPNTLVIGNKIFDLNEYLVTEEDYTKALLEYISNNFYADTVPVYYVGVNSDGLYVEYMDEEESYIVNPEDYEYLNFDKENINNNPEFNMTDFINNRISQLIYHNYAAKYLNNKITIKSARLKPEDKILSDTEEGNDAVNLIDGFVDVLNFAYNGKPYILKLKVNDQELELPWEKDVELDWYNYNNEELKDAIINLITEMTYNDLKEGINVEIIYKDFTTQELKTFTLTIVYEEYTINDAMNDIENSIDASVDYYKNEEAQEGKKILDSIGLEDITYDKENNILKLNIKNPNVLLSNEDSTEQDVLSLISIFIINTLQYSVNVEYDGENYVISSDKEVDQSGEFILKLFSYLAGKEITEDNIDDINNIKLNDLLNLEEIEYTVTYNVNGEEEKRKYGIQIGEGNEMIPYEEKVEDTTEENEKETEEEIPDNKDDKQEELIDDQNNKIVDNQQDETTIPETEVNNEEELVND